MIDFTETRSVFDDFAYMRWTDSSKLLLLEEFLDTLHDKDSDVFSQLRSYLQEQADVEEGY